MGDPNLDSPSCGLPYPLARPELVRTTILSSLAYTYLITVYICREFVSGMVAFFFADGYRARGRGLIKLTNAARTNVIR